MPENVHVISVDIVNIITQEFRGHPGMKWFDHKSHSLRLMYAFALSHEKITVFGSMDLILLVFTTMKLFSVEQ